MEVFTEPGSASTTQEYVDSLSFNKTKPYHLRSLKGTAKPNAFHAAWWNFVTYVTGHHLQQKFLTVSLEIWKQF